jgi:DNA (cytosine-5)-methyltransferase 1
MKLAKTKLGRQEALKEKVVIASCVPRLKTIQGGLAATPKVGTQKTRLTFVDLFSGAGGLSCGLEHAGFSPLFGCEINPIYASTYQHNHPDVEFYTGDVRELSASTIMRRLNLKKGELDLLAGGPPCQGFSINAPIRRLEDHRNQLVTEYIRIAEALLPKALLIENVPGIISIGDGIVIKWIYERLEKLGYTVKHRILFAGHYGVPQMRFRTIFLASRIGEVQFPFPTHKARAVANFTGAKELCFNLLPLEELHLKPQTTVMDAISDLPSIVPGKSHISFDYLRPPESEYQKTLREGSSSILNHHSAKLASINLDRLKHIPQGGSWRDIPHELLPAGLKRARRSDHTKRYGRLRPDGLCSTVLTKCDPHWGCFFHPDEDRTISVREAARIQSFPDKFEFLGNITQQYAQVGNAVPPALAEAIGHEIQKALKKWNTKQGS